MTLQNYQQNTLKNEIYLEGVGLFSGLKTSIRLLPQEPDTGIIFQRIDLPEKPTIEASIDHVQKVPGYTLLKKGDFIVQTVEHLLSALSAFNIDNVLIEIHGSEVPILDGSAKIFVEKIQEVGVVSQGSDKPYFQVSEPLFYSDKEIHIVALPSDVFKISYTMHYPQSNKLFSQFFTSPVNAEQFTVEIAPARTFSLYEEIMPLVQNGKIKGGGLHNALIIKDDKVMNSEGMRFKDEPVRHKVLDMIGDLSLVGNRILAHIIAIRSGHMANASFATILKKSMMERNCVGSI